MLLQPCMYIHKHGLNCAHLLTSTHSLLLQALVLGMLSSVCIFTLVFCPYCVFLRSLALRTLSWRLQWGSVAQSSQRNTWQVFVHRYINVLPKSLHQAHLLCTSYEKEGTSFVLTIGSICLKWPRLSVQLRSNALVLQFSILTSLTFTWNCALCCWHLGMLEQK